MIVTYTKINCIWHMVNMRGAVHSVRAALKTPRDEAVSSQCRFGWSFIH